MSTFTISERGFVIKRWSPAQSLRDVAARRRAIIQALEILHPVVRPLALEITLGSMDPETFAVVPEASRRLAVRAIPAGVAHQSALAHPAEIEIVDSLASDVVLRALTPDDPSWDVYTIEALVTAARIDATELSIERMPSLGVPVLEMDGARWAVGPVDAPGYRLLPPIGLLWQQEWGGLQLTIEAFWSLWWQTTSAEHRGLCAAERALDTAGFLVDPNGVGQEQDDRHIHERG